MTHPRAGFREDIGSRSLAGAVKARDEPIVVIDGISKRYPPVRSWRQVLSGAPSVPPPPALINITAVIGRGALFGVLGPNGAGKSTLFKILSTLVAPDAGTVRVAGADLAMDPDRVREALVPVMPDERSLHRRLSAFENLRLFGGLIALARRDADARAATLLERFDLARLGDRACGTFSSGQKQRLLLARALLREPPVLLLDEPTRSLDPIAARDFRRLVRDELCDGDGCTVLLATHSAEEAFSLCDRVMVLDRGEVIAEGRAADLATSVGDDEVVFVLRGAWEAAFNPSRAAGDCTDIVADAPDAAGWVRVRAQVADGRAGVARLIAQCSAASVEVAAVERHTLDLATVMERLVVHRRPQVSDA